MSSKITDHFKVHKTERPKSVAKTAVKEKIVDDDVPSTSSSHELSPEQDILRQFDLTWEYGPCTGISRLERWERAEKFGLNPPQSVKDLILSHTEDKEYTHCLWKDYEI